MPSYSQATNALFPHGLKQVNDVGMSTQTAPVQSKRLTLAMHGREHIVDISAPADATWQEVVAAAPDGFVAALMQVHAKGNPVSSATVWADELFASGTRFTDTVAPAGMSQALTLVSVSGPGQGNVMPLGEGAHPLGRGHPLLGDDDAVSRNHLLVHVHHGEVSVQDVGSVNGARLNGSPLRPADPQLWRVNEVLRVGESLLCLRVFHSDGPEPAETQASHCGPQVLQFPSLPAPVEVSRPRWVAALAPVPVALAMCLLLHSWIFLAFMLLSPLVFAASWWDETRHHGKSTRAATRRIRKQRMALAEYLDGLLSEEATHLHSLHRAPAEEVSDDSTSATAPIFSLVRLGVGQGRSSHTVVQEQSPSARHLAGVAREGRHSLHPALPDVPVGLDLTPGNRTVIDYVEGPGASRHDVWLLLLGRLITWAARSKCELTVVAPRLSPGLDVWVDVLNTVHWVTDPTQLQQPTPNPSRRMLGRVFLIGDIGDDAGALDDLTPSEQDCVVWFGRRNGQPQDAHVIRIEGARGKTPDGPFRIDAVDAKWFRAVTRKAVLAAGRSQVATTIPERVTASDLLNTHRPFTHEWIRPTTMRVPIGRSANGVEYFDLDRIGPHALVAGTTGSGKSEFLLTYLRNLFALNGPDQVNAILIDYKGGSTVADIQQAPHVVGVITDLDPQGASRALTALRAEVRRREEVLSNLGCRSFADAPATTGLARLIVVVDEYRVLSEEVPDFVSGLVRIATVGRSLGIHLVLATQRPGGAVTADMRANISARACLRVRERVDSIDVIEKPDAARIPADLPGRAFISDESGATIEVQTGYVSGPDEGVSGAPIHWHEVPSDALAQTLLLCPACQSPTKATGASDLAAFVLESSLAAADYPRPFAPIPEPLGSQLLLPPHGPSTTWLALEQDRPPLTPTTHDAGTGEDARVVAVADLPGQQAQPTLGLPTDAHMAIAGAPRSGRTTAATRCAEAALAAGRNVTWVSSRTHESPLNCSPVDAGDPHAVSDWMAQLANHDEGHAPALMVIDGWEDLSESLARINNGLGQEALISLMATALRSDACFIVTGGRSVLASRVSPVFGVRITLRQNDPSEYSLAGVRPNVVPATMPPGRGLVLPQAHPVQFLLPSPPGAARLTVPASEEAEGAPRNPAADQLDMSGWKA